jgi:hypothetical protein
MFMCFSDIFTISSIDKNHINCKNKKDMNRIKWKGLNFLKCMLIEI